MAVAEALRCARLGALLGALAFACSPAGQSPLQHALVLSSAGQDTQAIALLQGHLREHPQAVRERRLLIRLYGSVGNLGAAAEQAQALGRVLGPSSSTPWLELGFAFELAHQFERALELYDRAAAVAPLDPAGPRTGGLRAAMWGEVELAEPRLAEAARRDGRDPKLFHALGLVRVKLGDLPGAERAYRQGVARDPNGIDNHIGLATIALLRDDATAVLREYELVLRLKPTFADAELGRAWALVRLNRYTDAERALDDAARLGASSGAVERQRRWLADERAKSASTH